MDGITAKLWLSTNRPANRGEGLPGLNRSLAFGATLPGFVEWKPSGIPSAKVLARTTACLFTVLLIMGVTGNEHSISGEQKDTGGKKTQEEALVEKTIILETAVEAHIKSAKYGAERFFDCSAVHRNGEFVNSIKWLKYIESARFRLPQLPFLGL